MSRKKKKILAQAITLGLLLAMPLGVQATEYNVRVSDKEAYYAAQLTEDNKKIREDTGNISKYNFTSKDSIIFTGGPSAVYFVESENRIIDLGELGNIECTRNDSSKNLMTIQIYGNDMMKLVLGDSNIKAEGNAKYMASIYARVNTVIECGQVNISAVNLYTGNDRGTVKGVNVDYYSTLTLGNKSTISALGESGGFLKAWGISAETAADSVILGNDVTINTSIKYTGSGVITVPDYEGVGDKDTEPVKSNGESAGIYADSGLVTAGDGLAINSTGSGTGSVWVRGLNAQMNLDYSSLVPTVNIGDNATINVMNKAITGTAYGMFINAGSVAFGESANIISRAIIDNDIEEKIENGIKVRGIYIDTSNSLYNEETAKITDATVEFENGATIQAINNSKGGETTGVYAHDNVIFNGSSEIVAQAGDQGKHDSYGIYATSEKGDVDLGTASMISVINNSNDNTADTAGIRAVDNSKVTMRGGSITGKSADGENFKAIVTSEAAQVNVNADGDRQVQVEGNLEADSQSQIKMQANDAQSYLIGAVTTDYAENVDEDANTKTDLTSELSS